MLGCVGICYEIKEGFRVWGRILGYKWYGNGKVIISSDYKGIGKNRRGEELIRIDLIGGWVGE